MPPVDRDNPQRAATMPHAAFSLMEFMREFPGDAACLDWLWRNRCSEDGSHAWCPGCDQERKFSKVADRPAWDCHHCGHHLHPLAGTIFHKSSTSLHLWFYAIHLMTSTRCGLSAKQLERELGVTYKTAWRMFNLIRNKLMTEDKRLLAGYVEVDETSVDGKPRKKYSLAPDPEARHKASRVGAGLLGRRRPGLEWLRHLAESGAERADLGHRNLDRLGGIAVLVLAFGLGQLSRLAVVT
jgi:transposase